jgi:hypothetical protein
MHKSIEQGMNMLHMATKQSSCTRQECGKETSVDDVFAFVLGQDAVEILSEVVVASPSMESAWHKLDVLQCRRLRWRNPRSYKNLHCVGRFLKAPKRLIAF